MLWNDSINNEGDLSRSHHNLHFKAQRHKHTKRADRHVPTLTQIFTQLPSNQPQRRMLAHTLTHHLLTHFAFCALMPSQPQPLLFYTLPRRNR